MNVTPVPADAAVGGVGHARHECLKRKSFKSKKPSYDFSVEV